jgi:hypothetical protein
MSLERGTCVGGAKVFDFYLKGPTVELKCINNITERSSQEKKAGNEGHSVKEIGPVEVTQR